MHRTEKKYALRKNKRTYFLHNGKTFFESSLSEMEKIMFLEQVV